MTIRKKTKKIFEVAHDLETDTHMLAAEGDHGISSEELELMEKTVMESRRRKEINTITARSDQRKASFKIQRQPAARKKAKKPAVQRARLRVSKDYYRVA